MLKNLPFAAGRKITEELAGEVPGPICADDHALAVHVEARQKGIGQSEIVGRSIISGKARILSWISGGDAAYVLINSSAGGVLPTRDVGLVGKTGGHGPKNWRYRLYNEGFSMKKVGFIGYGSMGSMLVNGFLSFGVLTPSQVVVSTRKRGKIDILSSKWPGIKLSSNNRFVAREADIIFLCVKPLDAIPVVSEIRNDLHKDAHVVSIAVGVTIRDIQSLFPGKVTKVIPSLTSEVGAGISLICHNERIQTDDARNIEQLLEAISRIVVIKEEDFEAATNLTSCAPGIIASIFKHYVESSLRNSNLTEEAASHMVSATIFGTAKLLLDTNMSFSDMISMVATKGGITAEAIQVLDRNLPVIFDEIFEKTLQKNNSIKALVRTQALESRTSVQDDD